mmetsp:Transcript_74594/g.121202  ORF Transcript_74594/g.121202 Transcript_74594/m.121202 type:complete len:139 (-) Transcript_74594:465-881(-)
MMTCSCSDDMDPVDAGLDMGDCVRDLCSPCRAPNDALSRGCLSDDAVLGKVPDKGRRSDEAVLNMTPDTRCLSDEAVLERRGSLVWHMDADDARRSNEPVLESRGEVSCFACSCCSRASNSICFCFICCGELPVLARG